MVELEICQCALYDRLCPWVLLVGRAVCVFNIHNLVLRTGVFRLVFPIVGVTNK